MKAAIGIPYLAGFVDGDGSIYVLRGNPHGRGKSPQHTVTIAANCSRPEVILSLPGLFGGSVATKNDTRNQAWATMYAWTRRQGKDATILTALAEHLIVKRQQATLCLELLQRRRSWPRQNLALTEDEIAAREDIRQRVKILNSRVACPHSGHVTPSLEYFAGFFDAEGQIGFVNGGDGARRLSAGASNNCRCVLDEFVKRFRGAVRPGNGGFRWEIRTMQAESFLRTIRPFLITLAARADVGLEFRALVGGDGYRLNDANIAARALLIERMGCLNQKGRQVEVNQ